ncbi:three component ABC system middle component [Arthrobacter silvisoli]|uniref:three component ABC system middle component n=1 Tax=Arthrobacter silvisoli TaxID=2291022 RepID=UPI003CCC7C30
MVSDYHKLREWDSRSPAVAAMLNPALLATIFAASAEEYGRRADKNMPWELVFIIAPLVLHRDTRAVLPRTTASHLPNWIASNPTIHAGFPERAKAMVPHVREGLRFAIRTGVIQVDQSGFLRGSLSRTTRPGNTGDVREVIRAAAFLGRWLTKIERSSTVFGYFGVTP